MFEHVKIPTPDPQAILDEIVPRLAKQGPSVSSGGVPRYRTSQEDQPHDSTGPRFGCAIGLLISDAHYRESLEGDSIRSMDVQRAVMATQGWNDQEFMNVEPFLEELQQSHDKIRGVMERSVYDLLEPTHWRTWFAEQVYRLLHNTRPRYGQLTNPL